LLAERAQGHALMQLPRDVERYVARAFASADRDAAKKLLESAVIHDGEPAGPRLLRCALVASAGSLAALRTQIEHLRIDYRDVIVAGEYLSSAGKLERIRNLNEPISDDA
jgi:hypothetical protein